MKADGADDSAVRKRGRNWARTDQLAVSHADGAWIPPEILSRIFEAFFTTKQQGSDAGLGAGH